MATASVRLSVELDLYETHKAEWLNNHRGEFVVIKGKSPLGFFAEFQAAYRAGVDQYGLDADFLVKRVVAQEPVFSVF